MTRPTAFATAIFTLALFSLLSLSSLAPALAATVSDSFPLKLTSKEWCRNDPKFFDAFNVKTKDGVTITFTRDVLGTDDLTNVQAKINESGNATIDAMTLNGRALPANKSGSIVQLALSGRDPGNPDHFLTLRGTATFDKHGNLTKVTGTYVYRDLSDTGGIPNSDCFGSGTFGTGKKPSPSGGVPSLFDDQFSAPGGGASNMALNWSVDTGGPCTASNSNQDVQGSLPQGNPTPGLVLKCEGPLLNPLGGSLQSRPTFLLNTPTTFAVDARVDTFTGTGINPQLGMGFSLVNINGGLVAGVWISPTEATFFLNNGQLGDTQVTRSFPSDALFHRYVFTVNGQGYAEWRRDGFLQANTSNFSTLDGSHQNTGNFAIHLTPPPSDPSEGHFDNVLVTAP